MRLSKVFLATAMLQIVSQVVTPTPVSGQDVPPLPEMRFAAVRNRALFSGDRWSYFVAGPDSAPPLVLLHGIGDNGMAWRYQLAGLAGPFRVIAWNAPGYMLSDNLAEEAPGCRHYGDALADFLDAMGIDRAQLLANSFGSRVAQCLAMHHPARIQRMMFVGPSAGRTTATPFQRDSILNFRRGQVSGGGYSFPGRRVSVLMAPGTPEWKVDLLIRAMQATNPRGFMQAASLTATTGHSPAQLAEKVSVPVLLVVGALDNVSPLAINGQPLHAALRGSRLEILPGVGHLPHFEAPDVVNRLALEFFKTKR